LLLSDARVKASNEKAGRTRRKLAKAKINESMEFVSSDCTDVDAHRPKKFEILLNLKNFMCDYNCHLS
jgi:hypothetical protein